MRLSKSGYPKQLPEYISCTHTKDISTRLSYIAVIREEKANRYLEKYK